MLCFTNCHELRPKDKTKIEEFMGTTLKKHKQYEDIESVLWDNEKPLPGQFEDFKGKIMAKKPFETEFMKSFKEKITLLENEMFMKLKKQEEFFENEIYFEKVNCSIPVPYEEDEEYEENEIIYNKNIVTKKNTCDKEVSNIIRKNNKVLKAVCVLGYPISLPLLMLMKSVQHVGSFYFDDPDCPTESLTFRESMENDEIYHFLEFDQSGAFFEILDKNAELKSCEASFGFDNRKRTLYCTIKIGKIQAIVADAYIKWRFGGKAIYTADFGKHDIKKVKKTRKVMKFKNKDIQREEPRIRQKLTPSYKHEDDYYQEKAQQYLQQQLKDSGFRDELATILKKNCFTCKKQFKGIKIISLYQNIKIFFFR